MSDEEILASFMEPTINAEWEFHNWSVGRWWTRFVCTSNFPKKETVCGAWQPAKLTRDRLWEIEDRLTTLQRARYQHEWVTVIPRDVDTWWGLIHATPAQKITALASVLRPEVERGAGEKGER